MSAPTDYHWFRVEQVGDVTVVRFTIARPQKESTVETIGEELASLVGDRGALKIVLDFSTVERVYSGLIGKIMGLHHTLQGVGGRLAICGLSPELAEVFCTVRLDQILKICPTSQDAAQAL